MKKLISRIIRIVLIVTIPFIIFTTIELLTEITGGKIGDYIQNNYNISTRTLVYLLFGLFFISLIYQIYEKWNESKDESNSQISQSGKGNIIVQNVKDARISITNTIIGENKVNHLDNIEPDIKLLFDSLKERYKKRYESKLDGRFEITLEVNKEPFTVNYQTNKNIDEAFKAINESFNQDGRLLIVGSPGSGKTVLLLKLAIELLGDECKADQQIPVIFNLASWREDYATFNDWLIDVLNSGNGLSKDFADRLLREKRIIFLLDGLDELASNEEADIAHQKRAKCLASLNGYLREGRKAVICCRQDELLEMSSATSQIAPVEATVKVRDLEKDDIKLALLLAQDETKSRASANNLLQIIETNDVFLDVLATPFYFTTALEVFDKQLLDEKNFPNNAEAIKKFLLDRFIESKLKHTSNLSEFEKDNPKILKWLSWLAKLMEKKQLVSFELADLQPTDLKMMSMNFTKNSVIEYSEELNLFNKKFWSIIFLISLIASTLLVLYEIDLFLSLNINSKLLFVLVSFFAPFVISFAMFFDIAKSTKKFTELEKSYQRILNSSSLNIIHLIFFISFIAVYVIYIQPIVKSEITSLFIVTTSFIYLYWLVMRTTILLHFRLRIAFLFEGSTPLKYATFLDLAAEARILEKDGGHWRFRHQTLQEHFANLKD